MTAAAILDRLRAAGVHVVVDLALEAASEPPAALLAELEAHKGEVLALLAGLPPPLPTPLVLRDGRRLWRILAGRGGQPTEAAAALVAEAKAARIVTVADNAVLSICVPAGYRGDLPERLAAARADVLAVLHRQSDERIAAQLHGDPRHDRTP